MIHGQQVTDFINEWVINGTRKRGIHDVHWFMDTYGLTKEEYDILAQAALPASGYAALHSATRIRLRELIRAAIRAIEMLGKARTVDDIRRVIDHLTDAISTALSERSETYLQEAELFDEDECDDEK